MRSGFALFILCLMGTSLALKVTARDDVAAQNRAEAERVAAANVDVAKKQAIFQRELQKFIADSNKVKLVKWGEYDIYINENCPQPPTKPTGPIAEFKPLKSCLAASNDARDIAKALAKIAAEGATKGVSVHSSPKDCMIELSSGASLKLKPSSTKDCFDKTFKEAYEAAIRIYIQKLEGQGWRYDQEKGTFDKMGPTATVELD